MSYRDTAWFKGKEQVDGISSPAYGTLHQPRTPPPHDLKYQYIKTFTSILSENSFSIIWVGQPAISTYAVGWLSPASPRALPSSPCNTTTAHPRLTQALPPCNTIPALATAQDKLWMPLDIQCRHVSHQQKSKNAGDSLPVVPQANSVAHSSCTTTARMV